MPFLNDMLPDMSHQGIAALTGGFFYAELDDMINLSMNDKIYAILLAADHITDEGNMGAIIRTAAFFGVHGLIIPKDRSAVVTDRVIKRASGAHIHLPVSLVVNMGTTLDRLNKAGMWIVGATAESRETINAFDWNRDTVLILGSEDKGLTHSVRRRCHQLVSIPGAGKVESLNVSVACGVILSEIMRQRSPLEIRRGKSIPGNLK